MENKENVYERNDGAETACMAQGGEDRSAAKVNLAALGKFKDVNALLKAYEALEAEFTRRSQRLKELEKQAENFSLGQDTSKRGGAEKLKRNAEMRRAETRAFDAFVATVGSADRMATEEKPDGNFGENVEGESVEMTETAAVETVKAVDKKVEKEAVAESAAKGKGDRQEGVATQGEGTSPFVEKSADKPLSSNELYELATADEGVRLQIIGEYLQSVNKTTPPLSLGGAGTLAAPPLKARSIFDAGNMALQYFKKTAE